MPIDLSTLPRTAVEQWLGVVRLPVTAAAVITRHQQDESWPPALAFDAFEARVKAVAATVLHDHLLAEAAELGQERVGRLRDAVALEAAADQKRAQAKHEEARRRENAQHQASEAKAKAAASKDQLESQETAAKQRVREQAAAKERRLDEAAQESQKLIDDRARIAEQKRLKAEQRGARGAQEGGRREEPCAQAGESDREHPPAAQSHLLRSGASQGFPEIDAT